jgi:hypothetical protein
MRRMSFALTTDAVLRREQTLTRRLGWRFAKSGDRYLAVDKLRTKSARELAVIEVVSVSVERLWAIYAYGFDYADGVERILYRPIELQREETAKEGFPHLDGEQLARLIVELTALNTDDIDVTRIEFRYVTPEVTHGDA